MKKLFIIIFCLIIFCLITINLTAKINGHIGILKDVKDDVYCSDLKIGYDFNYYLWFNLYGQQLTWFEQALDITSGSPFNDVYQFGLESKFENIRFELSHHCAHPVYSNNRQYKKYNDPIYANQMTKIIIMYEF